LIIPTDEELSHAVVEIYDRGGQSREDELSLLILANSDCSQVLEFKVKSVGELVEQTAGKIPSEMTLRRIILSALAAGLNLGLAVGEGKR
jgi:hypothetical protein